MTSENGLAGAPAQFPNPYQAEGRRVSGVLCVFIQYVYNYCCFNLLKEFLEPSPSLRFLHGRDVGRAGKGIFVRSDIYTPIPVAS